MPCDVIGALANEYELGDFGVGGMTFTQKGFELDFDFAMLLPPFRGADMTA